MIRSGSKGRAAESRRNLSLPRKTPLQAARSKVAIAPRRKRFFRFGCIVRKSDPAFAKIKSRPDKRAAFVTEHQANRNAN